jgi:hypothetical protein
MVRFELTNVADFKSAAFACYATLAKLVGDTGFEPVLFLAPNEMPYQARRITEIITARVAHPSTPLQFNAAAILVFLLGFEPRPCGNLPPLPPYKSGVLPLHYRNKLVDVVGFEPTRN